MDTGTHFVTGLALAGLASVDPAISTDPNMATAVLIGTVLGSQAPDLDGVLRLKGNNSYIRNHRGISHSLPAAVLWIAGLTALIALLFGPLPIFTLTLWIGIAVCLHLLQDLFNSYGTQVWRPFSKRWVAWNIIHIFDPLIFFSQLLAVGVWVLQLAPPIYIFPLLYAFLTVYYLIRIVQHRTLKRSLPAKDDEHRSGDDYLLIPTVHFLQWNIVKKRHNVYKIGEYKQGKLKWIDRITAVEHPAVEASKQHPDIAALLYFSQYACPELRSHRWGYEVRWIDVRYRHRKQYPFVGVVLLDHQLQPIDSYVGWLSETKLEKKLRLDSY